MNEAFEGAVRFLARREHGAFELRLKLIQQGYLEPAIEEALTTCQRLGLQSDARFTEGRCRLRIRQGQGPIRIRHELETLKLDRCLIDSLLAVDDDEVWIDIAMAVLRKKRGNKTAFSFVEQQKQKQFLSYRGFSMSIIQQVFEASTVREDFSDKAPIFEEHQ